MNGSKKFLKDGKSRLARAVAPALALLLGVALILSVVACGSNKNETGAIREVTAIGLIDYDGVKLEAIAVEYDRDMKGADVSASTYDISVTTSITTSYIGNGSIGDITAVYVNDEAAVSETGGKGSGFYVIIEVFTDYQATTSLSYSRTMGVTVTQVRDITIADGDVIKAGESVNNNLGNKSKTYRFLIPDIEGFRYYSDIDSDYVDNSGPAFNVEHCFNQQGGGYEDVSLSYALFLPDGWSRSGDYALVTIQNPAAGVGTHPFDSVLEYRSASVYASDEMQEFVREEHGLDGAVVLVPTVTQRVNDNGGTPAEYEALVGLWDYVIENYAINENYIYGSGQSVGGMEVLETNRNRDNFFAGMLLYDDQWGQNYYIDTIFSRGMSSTASVAAAAEMHYPRNDETITWDYYYDSEGNRVYEDHDPYNYYYLVSDDNIMILNEDGGGLSNGTWTEMKYLYWDLVGYDLRQLVVDGDESLDDINAEIDAWTGREEDPLNINWISFSGTERSRDVDASYRWLLSQTRDSETKREKLDLNKPFETADVQDRSEERQVEDFTMATDGSIVYYKTGKAGAGTQGYNTLLLNTTGKADMEPGWLPDWVLDDDMSWDKGVTIGHIVSVTVIGDSAVAIEYDADMSNLVINLKGEKVYNFLAREYRDDEILYDPYEFYDASGNIIDIGAVTNAYVNSKAETVSGATKGSGSGNYVIVEFGTSASSTPVQVVQVTTVRTDRVFANASWIKRG